MCVGGDAGCVGCCPALLAGVVKRCGWPVCADGVADGERSRSRRDALGHGCTGS